MDVSHNSTYPARNTIFQALKCATLTVKLTRRKPSRRGACKMIPMATALVVASLTTIYPGKAANMGPIEAITDRGPILEMIVRCVGDGHHLLFQARTSVLHAKIFLRTEPRRDYPTQLRRLRGQASLSTGGSALALQAEPISESALLQDHRHCLVPHPGENAPAGRQR